MPVLGAQIVATCCQLVVDEYSHIVAPELKSFALAVKQRQHSNGSIATGFRAPSTHQPCV